MTATAAYSPRRAAERQHLPVRGLRYQVTTWGAPSMATAARPPLVLVHGWMDVAASWQFMVDALAGDRWVIAPDWRGYGGSDGGGVDTYWFADYLGDLDTLLDRLVPDGPVDLVGHSMGGNVAMIYGGLRPQRIRRLVNLEGFGMPSTVPAQAPRRLRQWLDELKQPQSLRPYASLDEVAARLVRNNPLLAPDKAAWLAPHWARLRDDGLWHVQGDPAHKRVNPVLYRVDEVLASWKLITAPVLWVEGDRTDVAKWWGDRYPRADFEQRLAVVADVTRRMLSPCGHMLHHDQPDALAALLEAFLDAA